MFFCDFCEIFKSIFFKVLLRVTTSGSSGRYLKMTSIEEIVTLMPTLNKLLSVAITLKPPSRKKRKTSVVLFRYNETIVFGIHSNFTYNRSSRLEVSYKKRSL